jgi:hypothetical protein
MNIKVNSTCLLAKKRNPYWVPHFVITSYLLSVKFKILLKWKLGHNHWMSLTSREIEPIYKC